MWSYTRVSSESELFGYVKGAFTGADPKRKIGKFELADKGTIFLDEIGDMPLYMQVKLLRVLQEREITKINSSQPVNIDVRIISATNKNLEEMIEEKLFREDLFYRLNVIPMEIPPLREKIEDIKILTMHFAERYSKLFNKKFNYISRDVWDKLYSYMWPENVHEPENTYAKNIFSLDRIFSSKLLDSSITSFSLSLFGNAKSLLTLKFHFYLCKVTSIFSCLLSLQVI